MRYIILLIAAAAAVFAIWHPAPHPAGFTVLTTANGARARASGSGSAVGADTALGARSRRSKRHRRPRKRYGQSHRDGANSSADAPSQPVDINHADADTLAEVPGFGPALAERIVAFRTMNGPFASLDELLDVSGVTPARVDRATPYLVLYQN